MKIILAILIGFVLNVSAQTNQISKKTDEQRLLAAIPELLWAQEDMTTAWKADGLTRRWVKPGQIINDKMNHFSDKNYKLFGLNGEVAFLFDKSFLTDFSFFVEDGEVGTRNGDLEFAQLYKVVRGFCSSAETRSGDGTNSKIEWVINGSAKTYRVALTRKVFGRVIERGLEIYITHK